MMHQCMCLLTRFRDHRGRHRSSVILLLPLYSGWNYNYQLTMQSVTITTHVASSNLANGEMYTIQHYVIKFSVVFSWCSTNKSDLHDIIEILKKVALNTITLTLTY